jgi:curved DNA-binding protein CbpA
MQDLYKKLQVDPQADAEIIRAAYHALARKYHPDAGGDVQHMVEFNDAWAVLGNPTRRAAYDAERNQPAARALSTSSEFPLGRRETGQIELPPRGPRDTSSVLDFGRYEGWSIAQLVKTDPDYLQWLVRTAIGRRLTDEVKVLLELRTASFSPGGAGFSGAGSGGARSGGREGASAGRGWFGRTKVAR